MRGLLKIVAVALFGGPGLASADPNLLHNGDFSTTNQLDAWWVSHGVAGWNDDDAAGSADSGSIDVVGVFSSTIVESYCFAVTPSAAYSFGGKYRVASGGPALTFSCAAYTTADCSGQALLNLGSTQAFTSTSWTAMATISGTLPVQASFLQCYIEANSQGLGGSFHVDDLFFDSATPPTPVRLQSFDVE